MMKPKKILLKKRIFTETLVCWLVCSGVIFIIDFPMNTTVQASPDPPLFDGGITEFNGDWYIDAGDNLVYKNQTIILNGNLIINNTGSLTFYNVTLKMNCTSNGQYHIEVRNGGTFNIYDFDGDPATKQDASIIRNGTTQDQFVFWVKKGAYFKMKNSELHECGWNYDKTGLSIETNNSHIENNIFINNFLGIHLSYGCNNIIANNTCSNNIGGIYLYYSSNNNTIINNTCNNNTHHGIQLRYSSNNNAVTDNNCSDNEYGIVMDEVNDNTLFNNTCLNNMRGIYVISKSKNNLIKNNKCNFNTWTGIHLYYITNTTVANNSCLNNGGGIYLTVSSSVNTLTNNSCNFNNNYGITLRYSMNIVVNNNNCSENSDGIILDESNLNSIENNTLLNNINGIRLDPSSELNNITNNTCLNNGYGISIESSSLNNILKNNTCLKNNYGIKLEQCISNTLINNSCSLNKKDGIYLLESDSNFIINNTCNFNNGYSIFLERSRSNNLKNNSMISCGIGIEGVLLEYWNTHNIGINNTINEKPVYYIKNNSFVIIPSGTGQVIIANCTNITVKNQDYSNGSIGIISGFSNNNTITNCTSDNNTIYGIYLFKSNFTKILNNSYKSANYGMYLLYSDNNKIISNQIQYNNWDGIRFIESDYNSLLNNFCNSNFNGMYIEKSNLNEIKNNTCSNNSYNGLWIWVSNSNTVINNTCILNLQQVSGAGLSLYASYYNTVQNNNCSLNVIGIELMSAEFNEILNNTCNVNINYGIELGNSDKNIFINNNCNFNKYYGVYGWIIDNNYIENSTIHNNNISGIMLIYSNKNKIKNNSINFNLNHGIRIDRSYFNLFDNNTLNSNENWGIRFDSADNNKISNNTFNLNKKEGILLNNSKINIIRENILTNNNNGIFLNSSSSNKITNNSLFKNYNGIYINNSLTNEIRSCNVSNNSLNGVIIKGSSNQKIHYNDIVKNSNYGVVNTGTTTFTDATYNYWGAISGPFHPKTNPAGKGDYVSNLVNYRPWLPIMPPKINTDDVTIAIEDVEYNVEYNASDPNLDPITWKYTSNATWLNWGESNHTIYGTPTNEDIGWYWVCINISDGVGWYDEHYFIITVINVNPTIGTEDISTVFEDAVYNNNYDCDDDGQGIITWSLSTNGSWLNINSYTGEVYGEPTNDNVGWCWVNVSAADGNGGIGFTNFTLSVINTNDVPFITTNDIKIINEDEYYEVTYNATDIDIGDKLKWTFNTNANWLNWGPVNHTLYGKPVNENIGEFWIKINISDGNGGYDENHFNLMVKNVNDAPTIKDAPSELELDAYEDFILDLAPYIEDIDNDFSELTLHENSKYVNVDQLSVIFYYPNIVSSETVEITVFDGIDLSMPKLILVTVNPKDIDPPTILEINPRGNNVPIDTNITVTFNEPMLHLTTERAFSINPIIEGEFWWMKNIMIFNPNRNLLHETAYKISIDTNASDLEGNKLIEVYSWEFKTEVEVAIGNDTDSDGILDIDDYDDDNDNFLDDWEEFLGTDPKDSYDKPNDTDLDGIPDGDKLNSKSWMDLDDDNDNITDLDELAIGTDSLLADTDGDGYIDSIDEYPLDPFQWKKDDNSEDKKNGSDNEDNTLLVMGTIITIIIIIILLIYLFIFKFGKNIKKKEVPLQQKPKEEQLLTPLSQNLASERNIQNEKSIEVQTEQPDLTDHDLPP